MFHLRHALVAVLEQVRGEAHRGHGRIDVVAARDVLLEHVVLGRAAQLLAGNALLLADKLVQQQQARGRRVDRHRRRHLVQRHVVERGTHVVDRVDRHARAPHLAQAAWVVGVETQLRRQVERHRQSGGALREQVAVALVGILRGGVARVLADRPRLLAVHLAVHAARVGELARLAEVEARREVLLRVQLRDLDAGVGEAAGIVRADDRRDRQHLLGVVARAAAAPTGVLLRRGHVRKHRRGNH